MPSSPEIHAAVDGISRSVVHEQKTTAPISSGDRPDLTRAARAASRPMLPRERFVYNRCSMPVLTAPSAALIGDQLNAEFLTTSSLVQTTSPFTTAKASI